MSTLPNTPKQVPCPSCGTLQVWSESNPWRPFCSERCKTMDLGAWAAGEYRIPGQENLLDEETLLN